MDRKFMKQLLTGMKIFFILIFLEVKVINLHSTPFRVSVTFSFKLQTQPPNLPKHDIANSEFHACIKKEFRFCEDAKNSREIWILYFTYF